jgi:hypothetical protein
MFQVCNSYDGTKLSYATLTGNKVNGELSVISQGWSFHQWLKNAGDEGDGTKDTAQNDIGIVDGGCSTDYVGIPDSSPGIRNLGAAVVNVNSRYCGARFGYFPAITLIAGQNNHAPIYDCTEPFEVNYFTDRVNDNGLDTSAAPPTADIGQRGLCLDYSQEG